MSDQTQSTPLHQLLEKERQQFPLTEDKPWVPPYPIRHPRNFEALSQVAKVNSTPPPRTLTYPWTAIPLPLDPINPFIYSGVMEAVDKAEANRLLVARFYDEMPIEVIVEDAED